MAWPTTNDPRTEFVTLRLTVSEAAELDRMAAGRGMSRSEAVRDAVARTIAAYTRAQTKRAGQKPVIEQRVLEGEALSADD